jgi:hypothetical protein
MSQENSHGISGQTTGYLLVHDAPPLGPQF